MNNLIYIKQDITEVTQGVVAHGVNCQGAMNSGVAKAIKSKWPIVYTKFKEQGAGRYLLGTCDVIRINDDLWVSNCYTQEYYGRNPNTKYASVSAIERSLYETLDFANNRVKTKSLHIPMIGCGLGGLDWDTEVEPVISNMANILLNFQFVIHTI